MLTHTGRRVLARMHKDHLVIRRGRIREDLWRVGRHGVAAITILDLLDAEFVAFTGVSTLALTEAGRKVAERTA